MYDVERIRQDISSLNNGTFLNTGTVGVSPDCVIDAAADAFRDYAHNSQDQFGPSRDSHIEAYESIAAFLGADPHEVTGAVNASEAINFGVMGIDWKRGDHVVISVEEHPSGWVPLYWLRERIGIEITPVTLPHDSEGIVDAIDAAMTDKTKMVFVSQVSCQTGLRVPERALADRVHARGALLFLDGSQSVGQFAVDLHAYDCDLFCTSLHKWVLAPMTSGLFYLRDALIDQMHALGGGPGPKMDHLGFIAGKVPFAESFHHHAAKFEFGSRDCTKTVGTVVAVDYVQKIGLDAIAAHVRTLAERFKEELLTIPGITLKTPMDPALHGNGIVTFHMAGGNAATFRDRLQADHNIFLRTIDETNSTRVSIALFTSQTDLDMLLPHIRNAANNG